MPANGSSFWDENIGKRLKLRRLQLGLSEESLGLALGVTFGQVQKYEAGKDRIEAARLQQIAEILKVPILFFFGGTLSGIHNQEGDCQVLDFLDTAYALRLVQAFRRIEGRHIRRSIVELVERVADTAGSSSPPSPPSLRGASGEG
jgi:transcriptional regulator with XRE-family HTH domain